MDSIVAKTTSIQDMSSLDQQIRQATIDLSTPKGAINDDSRKLTLSLAKNLVLALENPEDVVMRYLFEVRLQISIYFIYELIFFQNR